MIRALALCGGVAGAVALSQLPEFTQQYTQRLAGQVDALAEVVADFDRSALDAGLTRTEALEELSGTAFLAARQTDMRATFARYAVLSDRLAKLNAASPMARLGMLHRISDMQTLQATWADFVPAVPVTPAAAVTAAGGYAAGWTGFMGLFALLRLPFRRQPAPARASAPTIRRDPPLHRSDAPRQTPRLMGETRP